MNLQKFASAGAKAQKDVDGILSRHADTINNNYLVAWGESVKAFQRTMALREQMAIAEALRREGHKSSNDFRNGALLLIQDAKKALERTEAAIRREGA